MTAGRAWVVLLCAVTVYEVLADEEELLSRGVDRTRAIHPAANAAVTGAVTVTALHLLRGIPSQLDPFRLLHRIGR